MRKLSEILYTARTDRPDEWSMDNFSRMASTLEKRIAELEQEIADHKANIDHLMNDCHRFTDKRLQEHNLEQQAKGIEDLIVWFEKHCNKWGLAHSLENIAPNYVNRLRQQAKGLK